MKFKAWGRGWGKICNEYMYPLRFGLPSPHSKPSRKSHRQSTSGHPLNQRQRERPAENPSPHPSSSSSAYGSGTESLHHRDDENDNGGDVVDDDSTDDEDAAAPTEQMTATPSSRGGKKKSYRSTAFNNVTPTKNNAVCRCFCQVEMFRCGGSRPLVS